ncbi:MAG: single-stranded-DNA-specific exonuclease RecJ [Anaerolineae bacterium]
MTVWVDPRVVEVPAALRQAVGGHPLVAETLARRGITEAGTARAFLDPAAYQPADVADLPDLGRAVARLRQALARRERIAVWGDFDADGQTSTALLIDTLRAVGAEATFYVPGRDEGHGLHEASLARLIDEEGARLIVTCDTGVTAEREIAFAAQRGVEVIVTDHHVPGPKLPTAVAVVNPHRLAEGHGLAPLVGVGVAYALARGLNPAAAERALDLVALGTVADVGMLTDDNRYLVQRGLEALRHTERTGLQALYETADLRAEGLTEEHIGFVLGPRLNALGRLADARSGVELLTTDDGLRARTLASELEGLNARRQWLTRQVTEAALTQVRREPALLDNYRALVLSHPTWPGGVVGIVAGRLAERFNKPAILISAPEGGPARGSGRSVPGVDLIAALTECAPLLERFGGHAGAAGFTIEPERIGELRAALSRAVGAQAATIPEAMLKLDAYVEIPDLDLELVAEIDRLAPFGRGNPPLTLAIRDLRILSEVTIGRTGEHRRLTVEDAQERTMTVFWWQGADWPLPQGRFDLALTVRANDYRGVHEVQAEWIEARALAPEAVEVPAKPAFRVLDHRQTPNGERVLQALAAEGDLAVWAEGVKPEGVASQTRQGLAPAPRLALWTLPPGPRELQRALEMVEPEEVLLFGQAAGMDEAGAFLERLAGMVRYALQARQGWVDLEAAAAALGHRPRTVEAGLAWLVAWGQVQLVEEKKDAWHLARGGGQAGKEAMQAARQRLEALLAETAAYRAYLRAMPAESLQRAHS